MIIQGVYYPSDFEAKKAMTEIGRRLSQKGYAIAGDGSLSVRVGPNAIWITVAGADKGNLLQDSMVRVDMNGKQAFSSKPKELPEDLPIHLRIYAENKEVSSVMHGYPKMVSIQAMSGKSLEKTMFSPSTRKLGSMECLRTASAEALSMQVAAISNTAHGVLFQNDGCMTWGKTLSEAYQYMEAAEMVADVQNQGSGSTCCGKCEVCGNCVNCSKSSAKTCSGDCANCTHPCPNCKVPGKYGATDSVTTLPGVTPLIRPGENNFSLPRGNSTPTNAPAPKVEPAPVKVATPTYVQPQVSAPTYSPAPSSEQRDKAMNGVLNKLRGSL